MMAWLVPDDGGASERNTSPGATPSSTTTPPSALLSLSSGPLSSRSSSSVRNDSTAAIKGTLSGAQTAIPVDENSTDAPPETPPIVIAAATPAGTNDTASTSEGVVAADATTPSTPPSTRSEPTVHLVDSPPPASPQHTTPVIAPLLIDDTTTTAETVGNDEATASTPPPQSLALAVLSDQDNAPASSVEPIPVETPSPCRRSSRARHAPDHFLVAENLHPFFVNKKKLKEAEEARAESARNTEEKRKKKEERLKKKRERENETEEERLERKRLKKEAKHQAKMEAKRALKQAKAQSISSSTTTTDTSCAATSDVTAAAASSVSPSDASDVSAVADFFLSASQRRIKREIQARKEIQEKRKETAEWERQARLHHGEATTVSITQMLKKHTTAVESAAQTGIEGSLVVTLDLNTLNPAPWPNRAWCAVPPPCPPLPVPATSSIMRFRTVAEESPAPLTWESRLANVDKAARALCRASSVTDPVLIGDELDVETELKDIALAHGQDMVRVRNLYESLLVKSRAAEQQVWTEQFRPSTSLQIVGNRSTFDFVRRWMREWKTQLVGGGTGAPNIDESETCRNSTTVTTSAGASRRASSSSRRTTSFSPLDTREYEDFGDFVEDDDVFVRRGGRRGVHDEWGDFIDDDEDDEDYEYEGSSDSESGGGAKTAMRDVLCNSLLLVGAPGVGKTSCVHACAEELGYRVLEVNAGSLRSGRQLAMVVGESTLSHQVGRWLTQPKLSAPAATSPGEAAAQPNSENTKKKSRKKKGKKKSKRRERAMEEDDEEPLTIDCDVDECGDDNGVSTRVTRRSRRATRGVAADRDEDEEYDFVVESEEDEDEEEVVERKRRKKNAKRKRKASVLDDDGDEGEEKMEVCVGVASTTERKKQKKSKEAMLADQVVAERTVASNNTTVAPKVRTITDMFRPKGAPVPAASLTNEKTLTSTGKGKGKAAPEGEMKVRSVLSMFGGDAAKKTSPATRMPASTTTSSVDVVDLVDVTGSASVGTASVVLIDEVDNLFDDDKGFWAAMSAIMHSSKRPIVFTSNAMSHLESRSPYLRRHLARPGVDDLSAYLRLVCLAAAQVSISAEPLRLLVRNMRCDVRALLLRMQWICESVHKPFSRLGDKELGGDTMGNALGTWVYAPVQAQQELVERKARCLSELHETGSRVVGVNMARRVQTLDDDDDDDDDVVSVPSEREQLNTLEHLSMLSDMQSVIDMGETVRLGDVARRGTVERESASLLDIWGLADVLSVELVLQANATTSHPTPTAHSQSSTSLLADDGLLETQSARFRDFYAASGARLPESVRRASLCMDYVPWMRSMNRASLELRDVGRRKRRFTHYLNKLYFDNMELDTLSFEFE